MQRTIAIVGAGMSGAACAAALAAAGHDVTVFDKGRGAGGRMSARRTPLGHRFDHGAPWFTVRSPAFAGAVDEAIAAGVLRRHADGDRIVGTSGLHGFCKRLLAGSRVVVERQITAVAEIDGRWRLTDDKAAVAGPFDALVIAVPTPQAARLLADVAPDAANIIEAVAMRPQWTTMLGFDVPLALPPEIEAGDVRLYRAPSNEVGDAWLVQPSLAWTMARLEDDAGSVAASLTAVARDAFAGEWREPVSRAAHRWRYAFVDRPLGRPFVECDAANLWACGDWCLGRGVEDAWQSGRAVAALALERLS